MPNAPVVESSAKSSPAGRADRGTSATHVFVPGRVDVADERAYKEATSTCESKQRWGDLADLLARRADHLAAEQPQAAARLHRDRAALLESRLHALTEAITALEASLALDPQTTEPLSEIQRIALDAGAWDRAIDALEQERKNLGDDGDPKRASALHRQLARIHHEALGDYPAAARHLEVANRLDPSEPSGPARVAELALDTTGVAPASVAELLLRAAGLAREASTPGLAIRYARRALAIYPAAAGAHEALETALVEHDDSLTLDEFLTERARVLDSQDEHEAAVQVRIRHAGLLSKHFGRREAAREILERAVEHDGPDGPAWLELFAHLEKDRDPEALAAAGWAMLEAHGEAVTQARLLQIASWLRQQGHQNQAAFAFHTALQRDPDSTEAFDGYLDHWRRHHRWAQVQELLLYESGRAMEAGQFDERIAALLREGAQVSAQKLADAPTALQAWSDLMERAPDDGRARDEHAGLERRMGLWDRTIETQAPRLAEETDAKERLVILKRLAPVYRDRNPDPTEAIEAYREILDLDPDDRMARASLVGLLGRGGDGAGVRAILEAQLEQAKGQGERIQVLRRLVDLCEFDLEDLEAAAAFAEQLSGLTPSDPGALRRLRQLHHLRGDITAVLETCQRELERARDPRDRLTILRRMGRIANRDLDDANLRAALWRRLHEAAPNDPDVVDGLVNALHAADCADEASEILRVHSEAGVVPAPARLQALYRRFDLCSDPEERLAIVDEILRRRPDHDQALVARAELLRASGDWAALDTALARLQDGVATPAAAMDRARQRAAALSEQGQIAQAARVLEDGRNRFALGEKGLTEELSELWRQSDDVHGYLHHLERILLTQAGTPASRRSYQRIADIWLDRLDDPRGALATHQRLARAFPDDASIPLTVVSLQELLDEPESAIDTLEALAASSGPSQAAETLGRVATIAEGTLNDPDRALAALHRAVERDPDSSGATATLARIEGLAAAHNRWPAWFDAVEGRLGAGLAEDPDRRVRLCARASEIAEEQVRDPNLAFDWALRAIAEARAAGIDASPNVPRLDALARSHGLWARRLEALDDELEFLSNGPRPEGDMVVRALATAASVAEEQLNDPDRAAAYLERACRLRPDDSTLFDRLTAIAESGHKIDAVVELEEARLQAAHVPADRRDAYLALATTHEDQLDDPAKAREWLEKGFADLRDLDAEEARVLSDALLSMAARRSMEPQLADHLVARYHLLEGLGDSAKARADLLRAETLYREELDNPLAALQIWSHALRHRIAGPEEVLAGIEPLAPQLDHDEGDEGIPTSSGTPDSIPPVDTDTMELDVADEDIPNLGPVVHLEFLRRVFSRTQDPERRLALVHRRATVRERMGDFDGAMGEWLRAVSLDPEDEVAAKALQELAQRHDGWDSLLVLLAWRTAHATNPSQAGTDLLAIADLYEGPLERPEYALRARISAWRRRPTKPPIRPPETTEHQALWKLAGTVGRYRKPPLPKDRLLTPSVAAPETLDEKAWAKAGIGRHVLDTLPATGTGGPPPPPGRPDAGLPPIPALDRPLLPPRPKVASAWEELAAAYAEYPASDDAERIALERALANLWLHGAGDMDRAFAHFEAALRFDPEDATTRNAMQSAAEEHDQTARIVAIEERLAAAPADAAQAAAQHRRLAELLEDRDDPAGAEREYRAALTADARDRVAQRALCRLYSEDDRWDEWIPIASSLLEGEADDIDPERLLTRGLRIADVLRGELGRDDASVNRLEWLQRKLPGRREIYDRLVDVHVTRGAWHRAIDVLRRAADNVADKPYTVETLARVARIYTDELGVPHRAIESWGTVLAREPDHLEALQTLRRLHGELGNDTALLPVLETIVRSDGIEDAERGAVLAELERLARTSGDVARACTALEERVALFGPDEDPTHRAETVLELAQMYRQTGRSDDAIALLRSRLWDEDTRAQLPAEIHGKMAATLAGGLLDRADAEGALDVIARALEAGAAEADLLPLRARAQRNQGNTHALADTLARGEDPRGWLEAAALYAKGDDGIPRAMELYLRVLVQATEDANAAGSWERVVEAVDALVPLNPSRQALEPALKDAERHIRPLRNRRLRAQYWTQLARLATESSPAGAKRRYEAALEDDPDSWTARLGLAEVLLALGERERAESLATLVMDGGDPEGAKQGLSLLARILEQGGGAEAHRRLTTALRRNPDNLEVRAAVVRNRHGGRRFRDVVDGVGPLLAAVERDELPPPDEAPVVAELLVLAARSHLARDRGDQAIGTLEAALRVDPDHREALDAMLELCESGEAYGAAAGYAERLASGREVPDEAGALWLRAALHRVRAGTLELPTDDPAGEDHGTMGLQDLERALDAVRDLEGAALDRASLEQALDAAQNAGSAGPGGDLAMRCIERLLLIPDLSAADRLGLRLRAVVLGLAHPERFDAARQHAALAVEDHPDDGDAVLAYAETLEATDRAAEIPPLVAAFFRRRPRALVDGVDDHAEARLRVALARYQMDEPEHAIASLEWASAVDPTIVNADLRRDLADLYARTGVTDERAIDNHIALLAEDPVHEPSLRAVARHCLAGGDLERAWALFRLLQYVRPEDPDAEAFFAGHEIRPRAGRLVPDILLPPRPPDGGVAKALAILAEEGSSALDGQVHRLDVPPGDLVSAVGNTPLSEAWRDVLGAIEHGKVLLAAGTYAGGPSEPFRIVCQQPVVILAARRSGTAADPAALRFEVGRALFATRSELRLAAGLDHGAFVAVVRGLLTAFHPRHRGTKTSVGEALERALSTKTARKIAAAFTRGAEEAFDSREWPTWVQQGADRIGLVVGGDPVAAARALGGAGQNGDPRAHAGQNARLRALLSFASSEAYAAARRSLGMRVYARSN